MMEIATSLGQLDIDQLANVYEQTLEQSGDFLLAYQDFIAGTQAFFEEPAAFYALWSVDGRYVSALRVEPYNGGWLIAGLETAPISRYKGYAKALLSGVLEYLPEGSKVYSHVDKDNITSLAVHAACGFMKELDHAVYLNGSVSNHGCTLSRII